MVLGLSSGVNAHQPAAKGKRQDTVNVRVLDNVEKMKVTLENAKRNAPVQVRTEKVICFITAQINFQYISHEKRQV